MVYQLWNTGLLPQIEGGLSVTSDSTSISIAPAKDGPVTTLDPGQTVQIYTAQQGTPGGPVYYVTSRVSLRPRATT